MIAVALKGLAGRNVRALLTALAVVIGISMVSGTYILTDTMQKSFDGLFTEASAQTDAVISGKEVVENSTSGSGATIPAATLEKVRALPEVSSAGGQVAPAEANVADIIGSDGKAIAKAGGIGIADAVVRGIIDLQEQAGARPVATPRAAAAPTPVETTTP